jgi:succinate dehydrogenase / fumarate reductase, cytochrome b subunit
LSDSLLDRHYFLLRRLHSLTGIVPIGVFLIAHLVTNSSLAWGKFALRGEKPELSVQEGGAYYFNKEVIWINEQVPHLLLIEITLWGAIAFHSILGVYYAMSGKANTDRYAYQDNWRYRLQRISGYVGIVFIFYHVATLRWGWTFLMPGGVAWDHKYAASTLNHALTGGGLGWDLGLGLLYFVGVSLLVFHFANGLWTAAITWGLTISVKAQKRWGVVCFGLGAGLMALAWMSMIGAMAMDHDKALKLEAGSHSKAAEVVPPSTPASASNTQGDERVWDYVIDLPF